MILKHFLLSQDLTTQFLQSQCISEDQSERKFDVKIRARPRKKKVALLKPKNFILKNEKLRPIVTTNTKSGVFRSLLSSQNASQKKKNYVDLVPSNVLYSQSSLSSRIQSVSDFCNDLWICERTTQYMPNDWTRPVTFNINPPRFRKIGDAGDVEEKTKPKDLLNRNEAKIIRNRNEYVLHC